MATKKQAKKDLFKIQITGALSSVTKMYFKNKTAAKEYAELKAEAAVLPKRNTIVFFTVYNSTKNEYCYTGSYANTYGTITKTIKAYKK